MQLHICDFPARSRIRCRGDGWQTNIRVVGGLIAAHLLAEEQSPRPSDIDGGGGGGGSGGGDATLGGGWYEDQLLTMAADVAARLLPAFDTPTGIPYGSINLLHGVHPSESTVTGLATPGVFRRIIARPCNRAGTLLLEFGMLSRLTGDVRFETVARAAVRAVWARRSAIGDVLPVLLLGDGRRAAWQPH